jgi:hypothetical protein
MATRLCYIVALLCIQIESAVLVVTFFGVIVVDILLNVTTRCCGCCCVTAMARVNRHSFNETFQQLQASEGVGSYSLAGYDAVWTAAIGLATAARLRASASTAGGDSSNTVVTGSEIMQLMKLGQFPVFNGSAGRRAFLPNGDWDLSHTVMEVTNYGTPPGATQPRHATIATIDLGTYDVTVVEGEKAVWANGREYPHVRAHI